MKILLLGGYFASGKTTVLVSLAEAMRKRKLCICVIGSENASRSVEDLLRQRGVAEISSVSGGCVCCQATGNLIEALKRVRREIRPDWVLIELTGIGFQDSLREAITTYVGGEDPVIAVTVVDALRWKKLIKAVEPVMTRQLKSADVVIVNKADQLREFASVAEQIGAIACGSALLPMSSAGESAETLLEILEHQAAPKD